MSNLLSGWGLDSNRGATQDGGTSTLHVGIDELGADQAYIMPQCLQRAAPMIRPTTDLQPGAAAGEIGHECDQRGPRDPLLEHGSPSGIPPMHMKDIFR